MAKSEYLTLQCFCESFQSTKIMLRDVSTFQGDKLAELTLEVSGYFESSWMNSSESFFCVTNCGSMHNCLSSIHHSAFVYLASGEPWKKRFLAGKFFQISEPTHPRVFVRFVIMKSKIQVRKKIGYSQGDLGVLGLVWNLATPPTHIWENFPKKNVFFIQLKVSLASAPFKEQRVTLMVFTLVWMANHWQGSPQGCQQPVGQWAPLLLPTLPSSPQWGVLTHITIALYCPPWPRYLCVILFDITNVYFPFPG